MDGRNRTLIHLRIPMELQVLLFWYQSSSRSVSLNAAVIRLLETHPALVSLAEQHYNGMENVPSNRKESEWFRGLSSGSCISWRLISS